MTSSHEVDLQRTFRRAVAAARSAWGDDWRPARAAVAPGRIEILGNHVDYNGGPVLAAAIDRATVVLSDNSGPLELVFADFQEIAPLAVDPSDVEGIRSQLGSPRPHDYVLGTIERSRIKGRGLVTGRTIVATSIPIGSGMSSSAALCVALTLMLNHDPPADVELVYDAQAAENWTGVPCGTMDQAASVFGNVIRYEGPEGTESIIPDLGEFCFVVVDSQVDRSLGTSSYPIRVRECADATAILCNFWGRPFDNLSAVSVSDLASLEASDEQVLTSTLLARTRHVVTEIRRVGDGEVAMRARDWQRFGSLMNESGASSAGDYAISHPRVEDLVAVMRAVPGVAGARMMGGGEGGAALALLRTDALEDLRAALGLHFDDDTMNTSVVPLSFAPGARLLRRDEIDALSQ